MLTDDDLFVGVRQADDDLATLLGRTSTPTPRRATW
jgi:hypothetical protein